MRLEVAAPGRRVTPVRPAELWWWSPAGLPVEYQFICRVVFPAGGERLDGQELERVALGYAGLVGADRYYATLRMAEREYAHLGSVPAELWAVHDTLRQLMRGAHREAA